MTDRKSAGATIMRTPVDETFRLDPTHWMVAAVSRRSFLKSAAAAAVLGSASPNPKLHRPKIWARFRNYPCVSEDFQFDVFLSHNAKGKPVVRELTCSKQLKSISSSSNLLGLIHEESDGDCCCRLSLLLGGQRAR
jgi:hypothetical protein